MRQQLGNIMQKNTQFLYWLCRLGKWGGLFFVVFSTTHTFALMPFADSGKLVRPKKFEVSLHTQFISKENETDFNVIAHFDEGFPNRKAMNIRYVLGGGEYGLLLGSFLKWIPFPDYKYQPAVGASIGISYNMLNLSTHYIALHLRPLISKEFETVVGKFIPYLAFPGSIRIKNFSEVQFPLRFAFGIRGELFFIHFHKFELNIEFSTDFAQFTPSYFSVGVFTYWK